MRPRTVDSLACSAAVLPAALVALASILAACSSGGPAATPTVLGQTVGTNGTLLVAGSNQMTVYEFDQDVANSGTSACTATDDCIATWPALTVPGGHHANGRSRCVGQAWHDHPGRLRRAPGDVQRRSAVLLLRRPAVGDSNGIYTHWSAVKP